MRVFLMLLSEDEFIKGKLNRNLNQVEQFIIEKGVKCQAELLHISNKS